MAEEGLQGQVIHCYKSLSPTCGVHVKWHCAVITVKVLDTAELVNNETMKQSHFCGCGARRHGLTSYKVRLNNNARSLLLRFTLPRE